MVLEGIAALSLASSIVQFVDFGCRLFSESKDLYESSSGSLREDEVLKEVANSLTRMTNDLTSSSWDHHGPSSSISDFVSIAQSCQEIGNKILDALNQLNTGRVQGKRQCLRKTFERVWKYDKINDMVRRLELLSSQVTLHLVKDLGLVPSHTVHTKWRCANSTTPKGPGKARCCQCSRCFLKRILAGSRA